VGPGEIQEKKISISQRSFCVVSPASNNRMDCFFVFISVRWLTGESGEKQAYGNPRRKCKATGLPGPPVRPRPPVQDLMDDTDHSVLCSGTLIRTWGFSPPPFFLFFVLVLLISVTRSAVTVRRKRFHVRHRRDQRETRGRRRRPPIR